MTRFLKRTLFMLVPATLMAFVLWVPASTSDLGLQNVTLSCTDGTLLDLQRRLGPPIRLSLLAEGRAPA